MAEEMLHLLDVVSIGATTYSVVGISYDEIVKYDLMSADADHIKAQPIQADWKVIYTHSGEVEGWRLPVFGQPPVRRGTSER